ncbi:unnamed protein product [Vitrella brassicaformis CCMP3155]|uniref:Selenoprotein W n=1 Tax=Vitrella brassicaformis (strain CCMP3155) TaxID=1169540 RepID=A0A0G4G4V9_VITBC|nr:unnamed protein product [Vitrella brassicaformis CCMP3155]|eukprot:CEM23354.1 unnamed protein product [Vitrella brassicaformis CCMP3155]
MGDAAKALLLGRFPDADLAIEGNMDLGATGNFEITVDGQLVHSKKTKGHGFLHDNPDQQEAVFAKIAERIRVSKG